MTNTVDGNLPKHTVKAKDVAAYMLLPNFLPRLRALTGNSFAYLAFLIATIFRTVRILPKNHPYTNPANIGKFGIPKAIAAAATNIEFSRKNIDQIVIFGAVLSAIVLLAMQFVGLILMVFIGTASAQVGCPGLFCTPTPQTDIAFLLLDHVFGIPNMFNSNAPTNTLFHQGLHGLFQFYNTALLIVAVLIFLYYVVVVIVETAASGTPFGKRFSHIYAPFRLVVAIGLLVPLNYGLSASQYITLFAARMGSGLATQSWLQFNSTLVNPYGTENRTLLAPARAPEVDQMVAFMSVVQACREAYCLGWTPETDAINTRECGPGGPGLDIQPYLAHSTSVIDADNANYIAARNHYNGGDIRVIFGHQDPEYAERDGGVKPVCGIINIPVRFYDIGITNNNNVQAEVIQQQYYNMTIAMWADPEMQALGERFAHAILDVNGEDCAAEGTLGPCILSYMPDSSGIKVRLVTRYQADLDGAVQTFYNDARNNLTATVPQTVLNRGWGGAGMTTYTIADINGRYFQAVHNVPTAAQMPSLMEKMREYKAQQDGSTQGDDIYASGGLAENTPVENMANTEELDIVKVMNDVFLYWQQDETTNESPLSTNIFMDAMRSLFGAKGLFCMTDPFPDTADTYRADCAEDVHPLAQLVALGKGLVESAIRNMGISMAFAAAGGAGNILGEHFGSALDAVSGFYMSIATIGLGIGFTLYYVIPFLPFIYFFFAVGGWVKAIFEAMIGAPLWALAHLTIEGDGFSGKSASTGYILIFEIFLRPVLTVFGLIGGLVIFTAMVHILSEIFHIVIVNVSGYEPRDANPDTGIVENLRRNIIDEFFFTVIYTMIVYMMAMSSFKMIDMVPNFITRWLGQAVSAFGDTQEDPTGELVQYSAIGGHMVSGQLGSAMQSASRGTGQTVAGVMDLANRASRTGGE